MESNECGIIQARCWWIENSDFYYRCGTTVFLQGNDYQLKNVFLMKITLATVFRKSIRYHIWNGWGWPWQKLKYWKLSGCFLRINRQHTFVSYLQSKGGRWDEQIIEEYEWWNFYLWLVGRGAATGSLERILQWLWGIEYDMMVKIHDWYFWLRWEDCVLARWDGCTVQTRTIIQMIEFGGSRLLMKELSRQYASTAVICDNFRVWLRFNVGNERGCGKGNSKP